MLLWKFRTKLRVGFQWGFWNWKISWKIILADKVSKALVEAMKISNWIFSRQLKKLFFFSAPLHMSSATRRFSSGLVRRQKTSKCASRKSNAPCRCARTSKYFSSRWSRTFPINLIGRTSSFVSGWRRCVMPKSSWRDCIAERPTRLVRNSISNCTIYQTFTLRSTIWPETSPSSRRSWPRRSATSPCLRWDWEIVRSALGLSCARTKRTIHW